MKLLRDLPIQRKMLVMTLIICGTVLCVAIAALFTFQVMNFRASFQRDTATLADIMTKNSTAAMAFKDDEAGMEVVGSLRVKPTVLSASLCLPGGAVLAHYGNSEDGKSLAEFPPPGSAKFAGGHLLLTRTVAQKGEELGRFYLRSDYHQTFLALLRFYGLVILGVIVVSLVLAGFLSNRLGRTITMPIRQLARTTRIISQDKDYSVRAVVDGREDELGRLAESFNEMLGRIESQDALLSMSQQKMEALVHSIDGIVWERMADSFQFTFISRQSEDILGYAPEAWLDNPNFWVEKLEPKGADKIIQTSRELAARCQPYSQEYRMLAADGRAVWIRESGTVLVEKGKPVALRGIFLDVTKQKMAAEQLDKLNRQLIDTSRSAGMADIATGVLHNVGNVLNSVSVSATVVTDRLKRSKVTKLCRATAMIRDQNTRLGEFLTNDPKGRLIPEYLTTVSDELLGEQNELIAKMSTVGEHIEHIKEIVAMQQNYAKVSGVFENLSSTALVEDALRINATAFDRHGIELVREFQEFPETVCVDRHKVLQILINLLRNAKHALEEQPGRRKIMTVRVARGSPESVRITIADNGIGIPEEYKTKIFNHGFTTKKDGHGFGLHGGANAAREMGGNLTASSNGIGKGAEFYLDLPTTAKFNKVESPAQVSK